MDMVNVKVNGIAVSVPKGSTILEAARAAGAERVRMEPDEDRTDFRI